MSAHPNLVEALVGTDPRLRDLYLNNAWFHHSIEQLAAGAVVVVDGLAAVADQKSADAREEYERLIRVPHSVTLSQEALAELGAAPLKKGEDA